MTPEAIHVTKKPQRIRDPVHNLIEFDNTEFEYHMWKIIQTRPFQRLRRIKQLGFTDLVYPGATHTRFIHSIGTFHIARKLINIIRRKLGSNFSDSKAYVVLAASLLHDVGHGMFSHAFEDVLAITKIDSISHEERSSRDFCGFLFRGPQRAHVHVAPECPVLTRP